ncbi:hypothetical protein GOV06_02915 [Candidatus Woesearchaeota archaeon]|nr:hypothetical protein [Candidatus Woesearchaeota archaeon]
MKILAFVDLHGNKAALRKVIERAKKKDIELVVCAGDFTIFGEAQEFIMSKLNKIGKPVLFVHGNHEDDDELRKDCKKFENCKFIHKSAFRWENYLFIGWGGGGFSFRDRGFEKETKRFKNMIKKEDKVVLITHAPPYNTKIDKIYGEHAGCKSIRKFIEKVKLVLAISGHLHPCVGEDKIKGIRIINPGYKGKVLVI